MRRLLIASVVLVVLWVIAIISTQGYLRITGNRALAKITARLDADEPGWRLQEILAARNAKLPPHGENSAELVQAAVARFPQDPSELHPEWHSRGVSNRRPRPAELAAITTVVRPFEPSLVLVRPLHKFPRGGVPLTSADIAARAYKHDAEIRLVADLLRCEAELAALEDRASTAADRALAALNAARSIGDEPLWGSQLLRLSIGLSMTWTVEQVLAWSELPDPALIRLQSELGAESSEPVLHWAIRGERGVFSEALDKVRAGQVDDRLMPLGGPLSRTPEDHGFLWAGSGGFSPEGWPLWWHRHAALAGDQAKFLEFMTRLDRACDVPPHERIVTLNVIRTDLAPFQSATGLARVRHVTTAKYVPFIVFLIRVELRYRCNLQCAIVGIACERFRLKRGRWPTTLAELCPEYLAAVPLDPFDGQPLRFAKQDDGVIVHSVGPKRPVGDDPTTRPGLPEGMEIGFRLWNPDARRLPPPPDPPPPKTEDVP